MKQTVIKCEQCDYIQQIEPAMYGPGHDWIRVSKSVYTSGDLLQPGKNFLTSDILDLVAVFGLSFHSEPKRSKGTWWDSLKVVKKEGYAMPLASSKVNFQYTTRFEMPRRFDSYQGSSKHEVFKDRTEALWQGVKPVILDQLHHFYKVSDIVATRVDRDIEQVGKLIKFDTAKAKKEADLTIRPPKSWGKVDVHTLEPIK